MLSTRSFDRVSHGAVYLSRRLRKLGTRIRDGFCWLFFFLWPGLGGRPCYQLSGFHSKSVVGSGSAEKDQIKLRRFNVKRPLLPRTSTAANKSKDI